MAKYDFSKIEKKWQAAWEASGVYHAKENIKKPKRYVLVEFPYPSGEGLHMGHLRPYVAGDVYSRFSRMQGYETIFPIGWDAFGLPAENFAIKKGIHPAITTAKNIENAKRQAKSWGVGFDWSREVNTTDPEYYKWTQWIFLQFFKKGLAYEAKGIINWCPKDKTGLANEEVVNGCCERCGTKVEKKELRQWYLKITAYAEKLLEGLKHLDWPEKIRVQQENWIGRSEGAEIDFKIQGTDKKITVFTTRPDTLFGATYMVMAPEHPLVEELKEKIGNWSAVEKYKIESATRGEEERTATDKEKTGVELKGISAINPANSETIPIFIADYVLWGYGTGAIMAVPAHDERDFSFAQKFGLPIRMVICPNYPATTCPVLDNAYTGEGVLVASGPFDGMPVEEAKWAITKKVGGTRKVQYRLRDWVFSRQRYWGEPIPLVHCTKCGIVPVPEKDLPVKLPDVKKYEPTGTGESPLAAIEEWVNTACPKCGGTAKRETNTMPQWAGSSWYYLRYADPTNEKAFADPAKLKYWLPVDIYFGGMEHTTLHLLYSRFWHQFLYDEKLVPTPEPYAMRIPHGLILGSDGEKMSKSRGNVANPDTLVEEFGADALRMHEMFLGPHEASVAWNDQGILGVSRFLERVWKKCEEETVGVSDAQVRRQMHRTVKKVGEDILEYKWNTAISTLMICLNETEKLPWTADDRAMFLKILAPFAPHITEEQWHVMGNGDSIHASAWPTFDVQEITEATFELVVQVNGKHRATITVPRGIEEQSAQEYAMKEDAVRAALAGKTPRKTIFVKDRIINLVL